MISKPLRLCYFGIYRPVAPRDRVYLEGLKKRGVEVLECVDGARGFSKFFHLIKKHRVLGNQYDAIWVGYLSTMVVPLARLVSSKKIVFNALDSWYDRAVLDRGIYSRFSPAAWIIWFLDFLAFHLSSVILVESEQQKLFITKKFFVSAAKLHVVFTGVDETVFHPDPSVPKAEKFTVVFRGMFLPATGVESVIETARLLKDEDVQFIIIGWGQPLENKIKKAISDHGLSNVRLITVFLSPDELRRTMLSAHCMLGQFGNHERLSRTIQNKNFEAMALGMPFITRDSESNRELLTDGENCLFVPPTDLLTLSEKILFLRKDVSLRVKLADNALRSYREKLSEEALVPEVFSLLMRK